MEFKSFGKMEHFTELHMSITQKLHGTNAQICVWRDEYGTWYVKAGSRNRWLFIDDDNYGFAKFVTDSKSEIVSLLGEGTHYGEWCGPGINNGEGLTEKRLFLFNHQRWIGKTLPERISVVPELYRGAYTLDAVNKTMDTLKQNGSYIVPGYMHPEGIVVSIAGNLYKKVFLPEETKWSDANKVRKPKPDELDISHLLQPIRLQKLLSKDEAYLRDYPQTLSAICSAYCQDLLDEGQFLAKDADSLIVERKALGKKVFQFVKAIVGAT